MQASFGHDERRPAPLILGHEVAGTIASGPRDEEPLTINPLFTCGTCPFCINRQENLCNTHRVISMAPREGGFAKYIVTPERNLVSVPDDGVLFIAALTEPIA